MLLLLMCIFASCAPAAADMNRWCKGSVVRLACSVRADRNGCRFAGCSDLLANSAKNSSEPETQHTCCSHLQAHSTLSFDISWNVRLCDANAVSSNR